MRAALAFLIGASLACPAYAGDTPPARYLHKYNRGTLYIQKTEQKYARQACKELFEKYSPGLLKNSLHSNEKQTGCAVWRMDPRGTRYSWCRVIYDGWEDTLWHEVAHCNGWPPSHPS
jgi:hypothetical protein